jgi:hypothetical protein
MVCYRALFSVCRFLRIELWANISQTPYNSSKDLVHSFSLSLHLHMMNNPCTSHISVLIKWLPELIEYFHKSQGLFSVGSTFGPMRSTCVLERCWRNMSENRSVGSTFGPTRSTCEWNHCWRNISENRSFGSTFCPTRSTCELNHFCRNMSENMTWWNHFQLTEQLLILP